jgi:hypothetical protein
MTMSLSSPVTGSAQTGLTSPTYTLVSGTAPDANGRQYAVSALGGTQTGVEVNSASKPFTLTFWWPKLLKALRYITGSGRAIKIDFNVYKLVTRKGVNCHVDLPPVTMVITTEVAVPAGADVLDAASVRAAHSAHFGALSQASAGFGDTSVSGTP